MSAPDAAAAAAPGIGRIVLFKTKWGVPRPAMVLGAAGDRLDLHAFLTPNERLHESAFQPDVAPGPQPGQWQWPPLAPAQ